MSEISYKALTAISWTFTGLAIALTGGRLWIRCRIIKRLHWDDAAHLMGLLLLIAQVSIIQGAATFLYRTANLQPGDDRTYEEQHLLFVRLNVAGVLVTWCCLYAIKIAFLLLYHHIFQISTTFIRAWWTVLAIVMVTFWILIAGSITECGSPSAMEHVKNCLAPSMEQRQMVFVIYGCVLNVFSDLAIMALPLIMLKDLQIRTPAKIGLAGIFCCAFITIGFDILRAVQTDMRGSVKGSTALWTNLESSVAVIVSCLPSISALFNARKKRNDYRNNIPYRQRSLIVSDSAKFCISAASSIKSGVSGPASHAGEPEKITDSSGGAISAPVTDIQRCEATSIV